LTQPQLWRQGVHHIPMNSHALRNCLTRLLPHIEGERSAIAGGVAIGLHMIRSSGDAGRRLAADDVDFVAESVSAIRPTVTTEFLVSHFHLPQPGYSKFLVQLVDPSERLRLDVFPGPTGAIGRARLAKVAGVPFRVLEASDILTDKLRLLAEASPDRRVDPKHCADALWLEAICGRAVPFVPEAHLGTTALVRDVNAKCARCEASRCESFPIAAKQQIFDILGYV
jgi:hypothetical protein